MGLLCFLSKIILRLNFIYSSFSVKGISERIAALVLKTHSINEVLELETIELKYETSGRTVASRYITALCSIGDPELEQIITMAPGFSKDTARGITVSLIEAGKGKKFETLRKLMKHKLSAQ